jgi:hypothetical protein
MAPWNSVRLNLWNTDEHGWTRMKTSGRFVRHGLALPVFIRGHLCSFVFLLLTFAAGASIAQPLPYAAPGKHLGAVTCASSLCHGSVSQWKDSRILQNEYVTWSRVDKHATRAFQVLTNERSRRIAANLGLKQPAHEAKVCVDCHGHAPPAAQRGERFKVGDGIQCEACHGPSEGWIKAHVAPEASHAGNLERGLYPTSDPVALAKLCLSCHVGNADRFVTHRMMGAGHPRMSFELDTFAQTQPPHFIPDDDWQKRKGDWDPVRLWAIGQALAAREMVDVLLDPKRSRDGLFPELVVFDCHACHHPMSDLRWSPRTGTSPGRIRLNDGHLLMLRQVARITLPRGEAQAFEERVASLHRAVAGDGGEPLAEARALRSAIDALVPKLAARKFGALDLRAMVGGIVADGTSGLYRDYAGAEQATMAAGSLLAWLRRTGGLPDARAANTALDAVHETVKDDEKFRPERFRDALARLGRTVNP